MFEVLDHTVAYGQSEVIRKMNFDIKKNEIVAIVGRNGMGKTTLMKSLIGIIPSVSGEVKLGGKNLEGLKSYERVASGVAFVPQGRMIFPTMTVSENIKTGLTTVKDKNIPEYLYELFPVLKGNEISSWWQLVGRTTAAIGHC